MTGPDMRRGELCAFSITMLNSGGSWKSAAIDGKSLVISAGSSVGLLDDKERR